LPACARREGMKLFLRASAATPRSARSRSATLCPVSTAKLRKAKLAGYGLQLREKQRVKRIYGVLEKPVPALLRGGRPPARESPANLLLQKLECRLDNVVYRLGFSTSRVAGAPAGAPRSLLVNGKKVDIPSFASAKARHRRVREKSREARPRCCTPWKKSRGAGFRSGSACRPNSMSGRVVALPSRAQINLPGAGHS